MELDKWEFVQDENGGIVLAMCNGNKIRCNGLKVEYAPKGFHEATITIVSTNFSIVPK